MKLVVLVLMMGSWWGNGHATLLRALFRQLIARGLTSFFSSATCGIMRRSPDLHELPGGKVILPAGVW